MKAIHIQNWKRSSVIQMILLLWLIVQIGLIAYYNFALARYNIDYDSAKLFVHALEICRNHSFIIDGWKYITTAEFDCSLLFAVPFYYLTRDIYASFALSNMVFVGLWVWTVFRLFSGYTYGKEYALLALDMILIPYGLGMLEYFNMLFFNGGQYVVKTLCPLMLITFLGRRTETKKWISAVYVAVCALLLLVTTISSGIYVFISALIPILGIALYGEWKGEGRVSRRVVAVTAVVMGIVIVGYAMNRYLDIDAAGSGMLLNAGIDGVFQNVTGCFFGIFGLFGAIADSPVRVLSYEGVSVVMRTIFVLVVLGCAFFGGGGAACTASSSGPDRKAFAWMLCVEHVHLVRVPYDRQWGTVSLSLSPDWRIAAFMPDGCSCRRLLQKMCKEDADRMDYSRVVRIGNHCVFGKLQSL